MGKFTVKKRANGEFSFDLAAGNGEVILAGEGYTTKENCLKGIESVKKNSQDEARFKHEIAKDGRHYFNLTAGNGQIVGTSQMYASHDNCLKGIASVMKNAPDAAIEENL